jgi:hypothetical protein
MIGSPKTLLCHQQIVLRPSLVRWTPQRFRGRSALNPFRERLRKPATSARRGSGYSCQPFGSRFTLNISDPKRGSGATEKERPTAALYVEALVRDLWPECVGATTVDPTNNASPRPSR